MRLQALVRGHNVRKQAHMTLRCMQALVRVQVRVRERRLQLNQDKLAHHHPPPHGDKKAPHGHRQRHGGGRSSRNAGGPKEAGSGGRYRFEGVARRYEEVGDKEENEEEEVGEGSPYWKGFPLGAWGDERGVRPDAMKATGPHLKDDAVIRRERALAYAFTCQVWIPVLV